MKDFEHIKLGLDRGDIIPILGPGILAGSRDLKTAEPIPGDSRSLILAMNNGREMMPRMMYEFSRAAQSVEQKRGRGAVIRFLEQLYRRPWSVSPSLQAVSDWQLPCVVDLNRDHQLLDLYSTTPHTLIQGVSRIMAKGKRYKLFSYNGESYCDVDEEAVDTRLPIIFKPLGCALPETNFVATDADFVDYLTELMGGFAIPDFFKRYRKDKQYLLLGLPLSRDTERMLVSEISYGAASPRGWALMPEPSAKERRFCARMQIEIIECGCEALLAASGAPDIVPA